MTIVLIYTEQGKTLSWEKEIFGLSSAQNEELWAHLWMVLTFISMSEKCFHKGMELKNLSAKYLVPLSSTEKSLVGVVNKINSIGDGETVVVLDKRQFKMEEIFYMKLICHYGQPGKYLEQWDAIFAVMGRSQNGFWRRYKTYTFTDFGYPEYIGEVEKDKRVCRFCGKSNPVRVKNHSHDKVIFKDRSHAISYCLGNENLYSNEECDECNHWFGKNIEPDIEHRFSVYRAIHRFKNRENNERITEGDNFVIDHGTLTFVKESAFGVKTFSRSLNPGDIIPPEGVMANLVGKDGCVHANVYRCIAKYVIACLPKDELHAFQNTIEWVFKRKKPAHLPPMYRYEDASFVSRPLLRVFVRKDAKKDLPYCVAVLRAMDMVYCCAIPYCQPLDVGNSLLHIPMDIFVKKYYNDLRFKVEDFNIETPQIVVNHYILHSDKPLQAYNKQSVQVKADDINWTKLVINEKDGTTIQ